MLKLSVCLTNITTPLLLVSGGNNDNESELLKMYDSF